MGRRLIYDDIISVATFKQPACSPHQSDVHRYTFVPQSLHSEPILLMMYIVLGHSSYVCPRSSLEAQFLCRPSKFKGLIQKCSELLRNVLVRRCVWKPNKETSYVFSTHLRRLKVSQDVSVWLRTKSRLINVCLNWLIHSK